MKIAASAPRDLPFRFFNHVNSSGVRLTDYDLLKSHHLRFVDSGIAQEAARRWHDLELMPDGNSPLTERMLHQTLFRLRMWSIGDVAHFPFDAANTDERLLFRHFHATAETPSGIMAFPRPMQFDSLVTGGAAFFDFVSRQRTAFEAFTLEAPVKLLDKFLSWHSRGVLWSGIRALCCRACVRIHFADSQRDARVGRVSIKAAALPQSLRFVAPRYGRGPVLCRYECYRRQVSKRR